MIEGIDLVTLVVEDQEEALEFYVEKLGFELHQDDDYGEDGRWIEIAPKESHSKITIKTPESFDSEEAEHHRALLGTNPQITYRVNNCDEVYQHLKINGVTFDDKPSTKPWGISVTARDPSGNPVVLTEF